MRRLLAAALCSCIALSAAHPQWSADLKQQSDRATALVQAGKPEEAIPIYRSLAATLPNQPSIQVNLVVALYKAGRYQEAVSSCEALVKTNPGLFPAWLFLGASRLKLSDAANAEEPLRQALKLKPDDPNAAIMLADVLSAQARYTEAVTLYQSSAAAVPASPRPWYGLRHCYEQMARDSLTQLQRESPDSAEASALCAEFELRAAQMVKAFQHLRQALTLKPGFQGLHARLAAFYEETGNAAWASIEHQRADAEANCPGESVPCNFLASRLLAVAAANPNSDQDVYWRARAFLALSQQAADRLTALGPSRESYQAEAEKEETRGRYPEAVAAWNKALQLEPKDPLLQRRLALAMCRSNDCTSALPWLK